MSAAWSDLARSLRGAPGVGTVKQCAIMNCRSGCAPRLARLDTVAIDGRMTTGGHMQSCGLAPSPGIVTLWSPDALWCVDCVPVALRLAAADHECDRCHAHADPEHGFTVAARVALVVLGLCDACSRLEVGR